jgi:hypothetical protein
MLENTLFVYKCEKDSNENIIKILAIATLSLNLLQAKATLFIDGYMPKMLFMKVKDGGTIYGQV